MADYHKYKYCYMTSPIDIWDGATIAEFEATQNVIRQMPDIPRDGNVYKLLIPYEGNPELAPIYLCKGDNNGDTYIFSDFDIKAGFSRFYNV